MTSKFDVRRGLLFGVFGSGLVAVLASCESGYREPLAWDEPEPDWRSHPVHRQRPVVYHRKKVPLQQRPDGEDAQVQHPDNNEVIYPTGGGGHSGGGSSGGGGWSDRRLKTNIRAIGRSPSGLPIYSFRYVWGGPAFVGVMAQDLLATHLEAVILTESGYFMVDYDRIDVKMMTLADYQKSVPKADQSTNGGIRALDD